MKTVFITGATSGIGLATARKFANEGQYNIVICGRRADRLEQLKNELKEKANLQTLQFDVREKSAVQTAINSLNEEFSNIDILINNAGNAHGLDTIQEGDSNDWDAMMDINVKGLLYVSQPIIKQMIKQQSGHIINIGSTAGKEVYPKGNVYCASKHAVDAINKAMRIDLNAHGIRVGAVNPGLVETEFSQVRFKGDTQKASNVYKGFQALQPEDIADIIYFCVTRPYHVNIADLVVLPTAQASSTVINKEL